MFCQLFDKDVSSTTIELTMDGVFNPAYNNPQSSVYQELESRVKTAVSSNRNHYYSHTKCVCQILA